MNEQPPYAEYPRPNESRGFFGRPPGVYFDAIGEAWNVVRQDLGQWIAASIVLFIVTYAAMLPFMPGYLAGIAAAERSPSIESILKALLFYFLMAALSFVVHSILMAGMIGMGVRKLRGEYINVGMMFEPFRRTGSMLAVCLLNGFIVAVAYVACFLPVLYFYPVLLLMPTVAFLRNVGPFEALSITFDACKRFGLGLFALNFILWLLVSIGAIFCIVPGLIAFAILCVTYSIHYRAFFESEVPPVVPQT